MTTHIHDKLIAARARIEDRNNWIQKNHFLHKDGYAFTYGDNHKIFDGDMCDEVYEQELTLINPNEIVGCCALGSVLLECNGQKNVHRLQCDQLLNTAAQQLFGSNMLLVDINELAKPKVAHANVLRVFDRAIEMTK